MSDHHPFAAQADLGYAATAMHAESRSPFHGKAPSTIVVAPRSEDRLANARQIALQMLGDDVRGAQKIGQGSHPDVIELVPHDRKDRIGVDQVREAVRSAYYAPTEAQEKVCLIPYAESLTVEAANALLKTLEEPPPGIRFLLLVSDPNELLPTILSRSRIVRSMETKRDTTVNRLIASGYSASVAQWLSKIPLHDGDEERLSASRLDIVPRLRATADEVDSMDISMLIEHGLGQDPLLRRQALLRVMLRAASRDPDLVSQGVRLLAGQERGIISQLLHDMQQIAFQLLHADPLAAEGDPLAQQTRATISQRRLRDFCLSLDAAHRAMAAHGPIEAILLSLLLACEGEAHDN